MSTNTTRQRHGGVTLEMLLLLPVLLAVVIAAVEFALMVAAEQKLEKAATLGGRVAAQGGDEAAVRQAVVDSLGGGPWQAVIVQARLQDEKSRPLPSGSYVEVVATVGAAQVVPDMLSFIGFSLKNEKLRGRALLRKE